MSLALLCIALAALLLFRAGRLRRRTGLPVGRVIYDDVGAWHPNVESLHSRELRLTGRPDYLVQQDDGRIIPVELKSSMAPRQPWEGHVLQLAAYCLLVEENFGVRPDHGILQYKDRAFAVDYTYALEEELRYVLEEMQEALLEADVDRQHHDRRRCASCGLRERCEQRLA